LSTFANHAGERINKMVRNAEKAKTPVMCVVGEKEREDGEASLSLIASVALPRLIVTS
jgi:threonyl-tRNA synthetase